jgi:signal transduction histidine kinase
MARIIADVGYRGATVSVDQRLELLLERTARLHRLTAKLSTALRIEDVAQIVVDEGTAATDAMTAALWRVDRQSNQLVLLRASGYPEAALATVRTMPLDPQIPVADAAIRGEPVWLSSRADYEARYATSAERTRAMTAASVYSVAALPVMLSAEVLGVIALRFSGERAFDADEQNFLAFLALHCAQGFERARLYAAEHAAKERAVFLASAGALLGSSLDYEETLQHVASLAVPGIGDWCGIELIESGGTPERPITKQVAVAHVDPAKVQFAKEIRLRYPPDAAARSGLFEVVRTGRSELYRDIPDELLVKSAIDAEHLRISRELGLRSVMIVPIKDRGNVLGVITFVAAESGRRYGDDDLRMAEQLAERAGAAISNASLYAAAREAIRIRDEFMLVAGHELRTPLAGIALLHEAVAATKDGTPIDKVRERGAKLQAQTQRLARLVEDLLDVSRISAGRLTLERDELDLAEVVRDITERMREELERARTPVTLDLEEARGDWDRARLDQVITNLVGNAVKYGKGSPIELSVRRAGDRAVLRVTDHGIGIEPDDQDRIFRRFERAVSPRKFGGLGLGLWIASELVEAHGGELAVSSVPGEGATFTLSLPARPALEQ